MNVQTVVASEVQRTSYPEAIEENPFDAFHQLTDYKAREKCVSRIKQIAYSLPSTVELCMWFEETIKGLVASNGPFDSDLLEAYSFLHGNAELEVRAAEFILSFKNFRDINKLICNKVRRHEGSLIYAKSRAVREFLWDQMDWWTSEFKGQELDINAHTRFNRALLALLLIPNPAVLEVLHEHLCWIRTNLGKKEIKDKVLKTNTWSVFAKVCGLTDAAIYKIEQKLRAPNGE